MVMYRAIYRMFLKFGALAFLLVAFTNQCLAQSDTTEINEFVVPWDNTRPRDPSVAPNGMIWFVGQQGDYAAMFNPNSGEFTRHDLDPGTGPHSILVDGLGRPWYTGNAAAHIGRIDPETGDITKFPTPTPECRDPHTMTFASDGGLWFTSQGGNSISRLDTVTGDVEVLVPSVSGARPYGILTAPDGTIWALLFGTNRIAKIDPIAKTMEEIVLPNSGTRPRRIGVTSDGMIWYGDYSRGYLGRYNPKTGEHTEWANPGGNNSRPYALAVDKDDNIWFVETGPSPNNMVKFDPETESFESQEIPSGGGTIRHMVFDLETGLLWYGSDVGTLGGAQVSEPTPVQKFKSNLPGFIFNLSMEGLMVEAFSVSKDFKLEVFNPSGKQIATEKFPGSQKRLYMPIKELVKGIYLLRVSHNKKFWTKPFQIH